MASLKVKPRSPFWYACITLPNGKRTERSTGIRRDNKSASRREAQKIADKYESEYQRHKSAGQVRKALAEIYTELTETDVSSVTIEKFLNEWLEAKEGETSPGTLQFYRGKISKFVQWLGDGAARPIETITAEDFLKFRRHQQKLEAEATTNHTLKTLRMAFRAARKRGLVADNPLEDIKPLKTTPPNRRPITIDEVSKLLTIADLEWRSLILFGFYTGQRLGDLATLKWSQIDLQAGEIRFFTRKTGRAMHCPIPGRLREHILTLDSTGRDVHPRANEIIEREGKSGSLSRQFYDMMAKVGIVPSRKHRKLESPGRTRNMSPVSFHSLRHTATSLLKNAGVSASIVEELIGHDSSEINRIYTHIDQSALLEASERLPRIG
ncbi:MAG: site-specific integrase [Verrucomicrobiae bacterium]|nr:site-specific integrase [Verrucomicrobiae bacterium]